MKAIVIKNEEGKAIPNYETIDEVFLPKGDVVVKVSHSAINYSDAATMYNIWDSVEQFPHVPGIDFVGAVISSSDSRFTQGERVMHTSYGVGYQRFGGLAEKAVSNADWLIKVPDEISDIQLMGLGTVGLTAMLAIEGIELNGVIPEDGPILVTGATGGVGSLSIQLLNTLGYDVIASSGKVDSQSDYLKSIGATKVVDRKIFAKSTEDTLEDENYAGFIDTVGGNTLSRLIKQLQYEGVGVSTGIVTGTDMDVSVIPFVMRGITILGINSVYTPMQKRVNAWKRLFELVDFQVLDKSIKVMPISEVPKIALEMLDGGSKGRTVVKVI
ncbi:acrylyl-CoA reductase family protein [Winogradskyella ursingii]|uniref:acrylyl-CoA reductase family protein n=1 Tax=Winogradskyella ursingii TaxID=2686079 RepID=UPI0015CABAA6|nr:acryloyl-CoA reductase [Winogradskyella ursingii]